VKSTAVDYHAPARLDDELKLSVIVEKLGRASVEFVQEAWRESPSGPTLLCTGRIRVGCVHAQAFRPCPIPKEVLASIQAGGR
jgi:acyl-CoA thioester hydrolase